MIEKHFQGLATLPCWGVHWEPHVNLSMNFGAPHLHIREPKRTNAASESIRLSFAHRQVTLRGRWWLWAFCSRWTLSIRGLQPVRSTASARRIQQAIRLLDGQCLVRAKVNPRNARTRFEFDLGAVLDLRELDNADDGDIWSLYKPDHRVLSVRGDGTFSLESEKVSSASYRPIAPAFASRGSARLSTSKKRPPPAK